MPLTIPRSPGDEMLIGDASITPYIDRGSIRCIVDAEIGVCVDRAEVRELRSQIAVEALDLVDEHAEQLETRSIAELFRAVYPRVKRGYNSFGIDPEIVKVQAICQALVEWALDNSGLELTEIVVQTLRAGASMVRGESVAPTIVHYALAPARRKIAQAVAATGLVKRLNS